MKCLKLLPLFLLAFLLFSSCEEIYDFFDIPRELTPGDGEGFRIKSVDYYNNDTTQLSGREEYLYDDYQRVNLMLFSADMMGDGSLSEHGKSIFEYDADTIFNSYYMDSVLSSQTKYIVDGEKLLRTEERWKQPDGSWFLETVIDYIYEGDKLVNEKYYDNNGSGIELSSERKMIYSGDLMMSMGYYSDWWMDASNDNIKTSDQVFHYSDGKLDSIESFYLQEDMSFAKSSVQILKYRNNVLDTLIYSYYSTTDSVWNESLRRIYHYNIDGLLSEQLTIQPYGNPTKVKYVWEEGTGNVGTFHGIQYYRYLGLPSLKSEKISQKSVFIHPQLR